MPFYIAKLHFKRALLYTFYIEEKEEMNLAKVFLGQKFYREKKNNNNVTWIYIPGNVY
jgi:hypothetical protein